MSDISSATIKEAVYNLCFKANVCLDFSVYNKIFAAYNNSDNSNEKNILSCVLRNAQIAYEKKRPLCQDTGQVLVFLEIGQDVHIKGDFIEKAVNEAVAQCYKDNYFRKSVVKDSVFNRTNTNDNAPAIIYTKYIEDDEININVLVKGGGSENKSLTKMLLPTMNREETVTLLGDMILSAGVNACPPMFIGIGLGGTMDKAAVLSKEVFFKNDFTEDEIKLADEIKNYINNKAPENYKNSYVLDIKLNSIPTHIACLPAAVTVNCHSDRVSKCTIKGNNIEYYHKTPEFVTLKDETQNIKEINAQDINAVRSLKEGENILLTGEIYVARDMAHKKLKELIDSGKKLPFEIKDKIIFYAGPCPAKPNEVIGSVGPTTAGRMDKFAVELYNLGLLATIAKGDRGKDVVGAIKRNGAKYFTVTGGIAALLADKVKKCEIVAFEELGAEALYKLYLEKFPVKAEIG
jgi:fumarate hydratase class I